jgi:hypothetical protein
MVGLLCYQCCCLRRLFKIMAQWNQRKTEEDEVRRELRVRVEVPGTKFTVGFYGDKTSYSNFMS